MITGAEHFELALWTTVLADLGQTISPHAFSLLRRVDNDTDLLC